MSSCRGCKLSFFEFASITSDEQKLRDFLVTHHVLAGVVLCELCREECRVHWRTKLFCCHRQVSVKLYCGGGPKKVSRNHSFASSMVAGSWFDRQRFGNCFLYVRMYEWPFLRVTDNRKRCYKRKTDLILTWRCNTQLVLSATTV